MGEIELIFIEKLRTDILELIQSSEFEKKKLIKVSEEDSNYILEILNSIWEATQEGSLCVPVKQEWKKILKIKLPGLVVDRFENTEWVYFEKTYRSKIELERLLKERIENDVSVNVDTDRVEKILKDLESKSFSLKKNQKKQSFLV
ncbi:hypothetical protein LEP1GSC124_4963 [Leptospira interrogans serovar Pyrogenes str. 200701872]|uniref:Uncharacterized protein n=1 Tax=Leptospira interrogans serovar Pyrogenes str. 200701872 TaxID=1193029 RepID=M6ZW97_LEPIR|nr:hypothetical protein LEP1GSC124_4963 [Leptospira interrogans serovar Pyrogenes str. 200701872]